MPLFLLFLCLFIYLGWSKNDQQLFTTTLGYTLAAIFFVVAVSWLFLTQMQY